MKLFILLFCAFLEFSISIPVENSSAKSKPTVQFNKNFPKYAPIPDTNTNQNRFTEVIKYREVKPSEDDKREYFFIRSQLNKEVVIIDAVTYEKIISYSLPEITGISAIVDDKLYNIVPKTGVILSTSIASILEGPNNITWTHVGSFPSNSSYVSNGVTVDGSLIYFVTSPDGDFYVYDTISRLVTKLTSFEWMDGYASLILVQNTIYLFHSNYFYSFDGTAISELATPDRRFGAGLFQMGNNVCMVGGNETDVYPDPVHCYNPITKMWNITSYINEARAFSGVVTTRSKTFVFGGRAYFESPDVPAFNRDSVEVLNHETNVWSFAPTPFTEGQEYVQALVFYY